MISVAIIDCEKDIREGIKIILDKANGFQCKGVYSNAETAIASIKKYHPDIVLIDIELPKMSGIECVKILRRRMPALNIIIFTHRVEDEHIFDSLRAGVTGYLTKNIFPSDLLNALRVARNGGSPMSNSISRRVISWFHHFKNPSADLSNREREVLDVLCDGHNNAFIAEKLFISTNTVRFHLKNIYKKLQVNSKYEAMRKVMKVGMLWN